MRITAKYPGHCERCDTPFAAGTLIRWDRREHEARCTGRCPRAALDAARDELRQSLTRLVLNYARTEGLTVQSWDTDPTRRGSLAWVIAPQLFRSIDEGA